jgi:hypothetical protein
MSAPPYNSADGRPTVDGAPRAPTCRSPDSHAAPSRRHTLRPERVYDAAGTRNRTRSCRLPRRRVRCPTWQRVAPTLPLPRICEPYVRKRSVRKRSPRRGSGWAPVQSVPSLLPQGSDPLRDRQSRLVAVRRVPRHPHHAAVVPRPRRCGRCLTVRLETSSPVTGRAGAHPGRATRRAPWSRRHGSARRCAPGWRA